jgi:tetratricopeptide (TPR) repeat protein
VAEASELIADGVRAERAGALDRALEAYRAGASAAGDPETRAEAFTREADVLRSRCEWDAALSAARRAQDVARSAELGQKLAEAVIAEANVLMSQGDFSQAMLKFNEIATVNTDPRLRGIALQNIGSMHAQSGQPRAAVRAFTESLGNFQRAEYVRGEGIALNNLGRLALDSNDCEGARPLFERALQLARGVEDSDLAALASLNLAWAHCYAGDLDRSQDLAMAALGYFADCNNRFREIECLRLIGDINERCEDIPNAKRCFELALNLAEQIGSEPEMRVTRDRLTALRQR